MKGLGETVINNLNRDDLKEAAQTLWSAYTSAVKGTAEVKALALEVDSRFGGICPQQEKLPLHWIIDMIEGALREIEDVAERLAMLRDDMVATGEEEGEWLDSGFWMINIDDNSIKPLAFPPYDDTVIIFEVVITNWEPTREEADALVHTALTLPDERADLLTRALLGQLMWGKRLHNGGYITSPDWHIGSWDGIDCVEGRGITEFFNAVNMADSIS